MKVHIDVTQAIGRIYYGDKSFNENAPYDAVFTITFLEDGVVLLRGAHGKITIDACREVAKVLIKDWGAKKVLLKRHGRPLEFTAETLKKM